MGPVGYLVLVTVLGMLRDGYDPIRDTRASWGTRLPDRLVMNLAGLMGSGVSIVHSLFSTPGAFGLPAAAPGLFSHPVTG